MSTSTVPQPRAGQEPETTVQRIVVGVDGSVASVRALMWALEFAETYGGDVEAVTAWPLSSPVFIGEVPGHFNDARWQAVQAQRLALAHVRDLKDDEPAVALKLENAVPVDALLASAAGAVLVVLGARREHPATRAPAITLAEKLQAAAACPVLEVSALGVLSVPWGQHAFIPPSQRSPSARTIALAGTAHRL